MKIIIHISAFSVFYLLMNHTGLGQGLVMYEEGLALIPETTSVGSKSMDEKIENTYSASLRKFCPTPRNQGADANCVGWSVGYAAQTIRKAYVEKIEDKNKIDSIAFSPHFIYNSIKLKDCKMGAEIPEALQFLIRTGNVQFADFNENKEDCDLTPINALYEKAQKNKIGGFKKLFTPKDQKQTKLRNLKESLINGYPVVIGMNILESFASMEKGEDIWYSEIGSQVPVGGHALVAIGFDELNNTVEVINSWGEEWADDGFAFIKYDDFDKYVRYGFTFAENLENPFALMIDFNRQILITNDGEKHSEKELFRWNNNRYFLASSDYRSNSTYDIEVYHSDPTYTMYCFNSSGNDSYRELFRIDGSEQQLVTNIKSFGFTLPPLKFTDDKSERFIFIITNEVLKDNILKKISVSDSLEMITSLFDEEYKTRDKILSYSRVAVTGTIKNNVIIIPVEFISN